MGNPVAITLPVGRIVQGDPYRAQDKDFDGKPLVVKNGPRAGQATVRYFFSVAIPKGAADAAAGPYGWTQTEWGKVIYATGYAAFPQQYQHPTFAWKVEDGDSRVPNKALRINAGTEGMAGHWIVKLSSGFSPKVYRSTDGGKTWLHAPEEGFVKCGYYVQVAITVDGNGQPNNPGVYVNPQMVAFNNYGTEIQTGADPSAAGFTAPIANGAPPAMMMPAAPLAPNAAPPPGLPPVAAPLPVPVVPNPAILNVPPVPAAPTLQRAMTAKANGATYESMIQAGWTDAMLVQHGMMVQ